jgi:excisionase family DNA binding protein
METVRFAELPDILTPQDLFAFLPIGRNAVYDALKTHKIKSVRVGQKFLITKAALREFLGGNVE